MTPATLSVQHLSVHYREKQEDALKDVTLELMPSERVALLGLNGSGKTTLLATIAGLLPFSGSLIVAGECLTPAQTQSIRNKIGFLFSTPDDQLLFPDVLNDVAFTLERRGIKRAIAQAQAAETLLRLGIDASVPLSPYTLSQGQRQRVALAGALIAQPPLLLLDEPSASLDPVGKESLVWLLREQTAAMLIATHDIHFAQRIATRFIILEHGRVLTDTTDPDCATDYETQRIAEVRHRLGIQDECLTADEQR